MQIHPGSSPIISHAGQGLHQWFPRGAGNMQITGNGEYRVGMAGEVGGRTSERARKEVGRRDPESRENPESRPQR